MKKSEFWIIVILMVIAIVVSIASIVIVNTKTSSSIGITGQVTTGNVTAEMDSITVFSLNPAIVNFGNISLGGTNDTDSGPAPFGVINSGTVKINMTIQSSESLLKGSSPTYQFKSVCAETDCATTVYDWTTFDQTAQLLVGDLDFNNTKDALSVGIKIAVPADEPAGAKSDILTFTAFEA